MIALPASVIRIISVILAAVFIPLGALTSGIDKINAPERSETASVNVAGIGAYFRSQGIAYDGENYYFSCKTSLIKTGSDPSKAELVNLDAIPGLLADDYGIAHIGGISYYDGRIYAGLEDSKVWQHPMIGVYDAQTLEFIEAYELDPELVTRGVPFVTVDPQTGYLCCVNHSKEPDRLCIYDTANAMREVGVLMLSQSVASIQGAEFYDGSLYAATNDETAAIYRIDEDGTVTKVLDRNLVSGSEGEGMTIVNKDGRPCIAAVDMGPLFVNAFIRYFDI